MPKSLVRLRTPSVVTSPGLRQLASKGQGALFGRGKARPVVTRERPTALGNLRRRHADDFPVHLAVAHAVGTVDGAGDDPEQAQAEHPVKSPAILLAVDPHYGLPRNCQLWHVAKGNEAPDHARAFHTHTARLELAPTGHGKPRRAAPLVVQFRLERIVILAHPFGASLTRSLPVC